MTAIGDNWFWESPYPKPFQNESTLKGVNKCQFFALLQANNLIKTKHFINLYRPNPWRCP